MQWGDEDGWLLATHTMTLGPFGHVAFNLGSLIPSLPENYKGIIVIEAVDPVDRFLAWSLYDDGSRVNSSLPSGRAIQPVAILERVVRVYRALLEEARPLLGDAPVQFEIINGTADLNAYATSDGKRVMITRPMVELLADSPDELAHILGHELGHIIQFRRGYNVMVEDKEFDADIVGAVLAVGAGFNPYALAGWLARAAMVTGTADLRSAAQAEFDSMLLIDAHSSINQRITEAFNNLRKVCQFPGMTSACEDIKRLHRPNLPPAAPLGRGSRVRLQ